MFCLTAGVVVAVWPCRNRLSRWPSSPHLGRADPGSFVGVAGGAEAVREHRAHRGRGCEDAGAVWQAVAVKGEAERAFPEHDGSGSVAGITASLDAGQIPGAGCGAGMELKAGEPRPAGP